MVSDVKSALLGLGWARPHLGHSLLMSLVAHDELMMKLQRDTVLAHRDSTK